MKALSVVETAHCIISEELDMTVATAATMLFLIRLKARRRADIIMSNQGWWLLHSLFSWQHHWQEQWLPDRLLLHGLWLLLLH